MSLDLIDDLGNYKLEEKKSAHKNIRIWSLRWLDQVEHKKRSKNTLRAYRTVLSLFIDFSKKRKEIPFRDIGSKYINKHLIAYQLSLALKHGDKNDIRIAKEQNSKKVLGKNYSNFKVIPRFENTLSHRINVIKDFLKFVSLNNLDQKDYTRLFPDIAKIVIGEKNTPYLTVSELDRILNYMKKWDKIFKDHKPKGSERYAIREAFLLTLYAVTGARGEEIVTIKLSDISKIKSGKSVGYSIKIHGKGGKIRTIGIKEKYIVDYVRYFTSVLPSPDYYISSTWRKGSYTNKPMDVNALRVFSNYILEFLDINKNGLHSYRRGFVTRKVMVDNLSVGRVAKMVGNSSAVLEKYYLKDEVTLDD